MSHTSVTRRLGTIFAAPIYVVFLALSALFVGLYAFLCAAVSSRPVSDEVVSDKQRGGANTRRWRYIALDAATVVVAYVVADILRVTLRQQTAWPEQLDGYGSTLTTHLLVLAVISVAWVIILNRLGWYHATMRTLRWRLRNIVMATVLLTLTLSTTALLLARDVYPRAQIGFFLLALPIISALVHGGMEWWRGGATDGAGAPIRMRRAW